LRGVNLSERKSKIDIVFACFRPNTLREITIFRSEPPVQQTNTCSGFRAVAAVYEFRNLSQQCCNSVQSGLFTHFTSALKHLSKKQMDLKNAQVQPGSALILTCTNKS
jgi:hypothetical protein